MGTAIDKKRNQIAAMLFAMRVTDVVGGIGEISVIAVIKDHPDIRIP